MHTIYIESKPNLQYTEWTETVRAKSKSAARRKANKIVWNAGVNAENVRRHQNELDETIERWTIS